MAVTVDKLSKEFSERLRPIQFAMLKCLSVDPEALLSNARDLEWRAEGLDGLWEQAARWPEGQAVLKLAGSLQADNPLPSLITEMLDPRVRIPTLDSDGTSLV